MWSPPEWSTLHCPNIIEFKICFKLDSCKLGGGGIFMQRLDHSDKAFKRQTVELISSQNHWRRQKLCNTDTWSSDTGFLGKSKFVNFVENVTITSNVVLNTGYETKNELENVFSGAALHSLNHSHRDLTKEKSSKLYFWFNLSPGFRIDSCRVEGSCPLPV